MRKIFLVLFAVLILLNVTCKTSNETVVEYNYNDQINRDAAKVNIQLPFYKGVNFSGWFETQSPQSIVFSIFTEQDFIDAKNLGIEVIRLPIRMNDMAGKAPDYKLDPFFLNLLDTAVDWAEKHQLYLILDNHTFDSENDTDSDMEKILIPVWKQMAEHYKNRSKYILYEVLNEPHGITAEKWGGIQDRAIAAIRKIDAVHTIVVGGTGWNSINDLFTLPVYPYENLIYTFHFYDPHIFTHQGATWGGPLTLHALKGMPFPVDAHTMPTLPAIYKGTWIESNFNDYKREATIKALELQLDKAVQFSLERGVPVFCGEYGVFIPNSPPEDRVRWYDIVTQLFDIRGIVRTSWDYFTGFGIFKTERGGSIESDLNIDIVNAMGYKAPPQKPAEKMRSGFTLFDHYPNAKINNMNNWSSKINLYYPNGEKYAIAWENASQYGSINFHFKADIDWDYLQSNSYALYFNVKADKAAKIDVRFVNYEDNNNIPWRIKSSLNINSGGWNTIKVPLNEMNEQGAWVNATSQWVNPSGLFEWQRVVTLQFVSEEEPLTSLLLFDKIWIDK